MDGFSGNLNKAASDGLTIQQNVVMQLFGPDGVEKDRREVHNTIPTAGLHGVIDQLLASPTFVKPGWMEVGTGTGGTTKLNAYIAGSRTALDSKARTNAVVTMICTFAAGVGTGAITEAGIFSVVTEDTVAATTPMYAYTSFAVVNKGALDSYVITWTFTLSQPA